MECDVYTNSDDHDCTAVGQFWTCCLPDQVVTISDFTVSKIAFGNEHCLFVTEQGKVYSFGKGVYGQLGLGDTSDHLTEPCQVKNLPEIVSIACGPQCSAALSSDGKVFMWGDNSTGQCGQDNLEKILSPVQVSISDPSTKCEKCSILINTNVIIKKISCGEFHTLAVSNDYELWTWGKTLELDPIDISYSYPKIVEFLKGKKVLSVACGSTHSLAVVEVNSIENDLNLSILCSTCKKNTISNCDGQKSEGSGDTCPLGLPVEYEKNLILNPETVDKQNDLSILHGNSIDKQCALDTEAITDINITSSSEQNTVSVDKEEKLEQRLNLVAVNKETIEITPDVNERNGLNDGNAEVIPVENICHPSHESNKRSSSLIDQELAKEFLVRQFCELSQSTEKQHVDTATVDGANQKGKPEWELSFMKDIVGKVKTTVDRFNFVSSGHRFHESYVDSSQSSQESFEVIEIEGSSASASVIESSLQSIKRAGSLKSVLEAKIFQRQRSRKGSLESLVSDKQERWKNKKKHINVRPCVQTEVWSWGTGKHGKLGHGDELDRLQPCCIKFLTGQGVVRVVAGGEHSIALTADCQVYTWGKNNYLQLGHSLNSKMILSPKLIELSQHLVWDIAAGGNHTLLLADVRTPQIALFYCGSHESSNGLEQCVCLKRRGLVQLNILKKSGLITRVFAGGPYAGCVVDQQGIGEMPVLHEFAATERKYLNQMQTVLVKVLRPMLTDGNLPADAASPFSDTVKSLIGQFAEMIDMIALNAYDLTLLVQGKYNVDSVYILENEEDWLELYLNYMKSYCDVIAVTAFSAYIKNLSTAITAVARTTHGEIALEQKSLSDIFVMLLNIPVKRIMDYVRLFTRITSVVPKRIPDRDLQKTITLWRHVSETANREVFLADNTRQFWDNAPQKLVDAFRTSQRRLIRDSRSVPLNLSSSGRFSSHMFFLFNDIFVHSQFGGLQSYPLQLVWVEPLPDTNNLQYAITLTMPEEVLILTCPSSTEKTDWVCALNQAIKKTLDNDKGIKEIVAGLTQSHRRLSPPLARQATYVFNKHPLYKDAKYSGMWLCGKLHGNGEMIWPDGRKYVGKFNLNIQHGEGMFLLPFGDLFITYEGYWKEGKQNGLGSVRYPNGDVYEGYFKDDMRHGHGVLKIGQFLSSAASIYIGQWVCNRRQGYGVMDDIRSGEKYMGMWLDDCRHGNGMVVTIDGIYYEGTFNMDKLSGFGIMIFEDNTCFEGELGAGGVLNGKGTLYLSNGDKIDGHFTGKCNDSIKVNGTYQKSQCSPTSLSRLHDKKKIKLSSFGQQCVPADKKWEDIFSHCQDMLGVQGVNLKQDTEKAWEAIAVAVSKRKKELQSKKRPQINEEDVDFLERIPKTALGNEKLNYDDYKEIEEYLQKATDCHFHPLGLLLEGLVDVYRAAYLGVGAHPHLLPHAVAEIHSYVKRMYSVIRILFPGLPSYDQPLVLSSTHKISRSEEWITLAEAENEYDSVIVTPASLLHPLLLPRIYPPLFTLYALYNEKEDEKYWKRLLKWNKQSDIALMTFLEVDVKFWGLPEMDDIRQHRKSFSKIKDKCFAKAVETLQHISTAFTALEKLKIIHQTFNEINKEVQNNLSTDFLWRMDDLFPVFQYVVIRSRIRHLGSEIHLVDDLMESHLQHGELGIMFTTLKACYFQIRTEKIANY